MNGDKGKRSKNIEDADIVEVVSLIDGWSGKLSWDLLIDAIEKRRYTRYTRQALHRHERIGQAYALRKKALSTKLDTEEPQYSSPEVQVLSELNTKLTAETTRLKMENERLLEQFVRWAYNAHSRGIGHDFLNQPLPGVNRDLTVPHVHVKATPKRK